MRSRIVPGRRIPVAGGGGALPTYSADLDAGDDFTRTPSAASTAQTLSMSIKLDTLAANQYIYSVAFTSMVRDCFIVVNTSGNIWIYDQVGTSVSQAITNTTTLTTGVDYHLLFHLDGTNGTAGDRYKVWVNGTAQSFGTYTTIGNTEFDASVEHSIGQRVSGGGTFDGHMYQIIQVHGTLEPISTFWSSGLIAPTIGAYGAEGFQLDFAASGDMGNDVSGNANDWTVNGTPTQSADIP